MGIMQNIARTLFGGQRKEKTVKAAQKSKVSAENRRQTMDEIFRPDFPRKAIRQTGYSTSSWMNKKPYRLPLAEMMGAGSSQVVWGKHHSQDIQKINKRMRENRRARRAAKKRVL